MWNELFDLSGKVALVTGGSKGIGKAMARGYAEAGADIAISARHEGDLKSAAEEIRSGLDITVKYFIADMADRGQADKLASDVLSEFGRVDIVVNNAGSNVPQTLVETTDESWDRILELNFSSCMRLSRAVAPQMIERKWGRIIHISSIMGLTSNPGRGIYSGTKAALIGMMRAHALELGPHGVTVNCIAPGPVKTDLPMSILSDEQKRVFAERTAVKRWGETIDMVGPALLLGSDAGAFITGTTIVADGGCIVRTFD